MRRILIPVGKAALFVVITGLLLAVIVPRYLDRVYHRGPPSGHFDGARFFNPDGGDEGANPPGGGGRLGFLWRNLTDDRPTWPDAVPVVQARPDELLQPYMPPVFYVQGNAETIAATPMRVTWVGHASVLVQTPSFNILTDPVWSERAGPPFLGPRRVALPGIAWEALPRIDLVLVSHNHYDHLDLKTLKRLWERDRPLIVTAPGNDAILRSAGIGAVAADWGRAVTVEGRPRIAPNFYSPRPIRVHVMRNHHWSSRWFADRNRALWSSFVVDLPGGNLFFAGDTGFGDGRWPEEARALGPIRLALIPIGAFRFVPGQMASDSHIGPVQAARVFAGLGATSAIPIHWGTFRLSYEGYRTPPELLRATTACTGQRGFAPVAIGRPVDVPPVEARVARPIPAAAQVDRCLSTPAVRAMR